MQRELERQKERLLAEHNKIYDEMNRSQYKQFMNFEEEWKKYLEEFRMQSHDRINKTKTHKLKELSSETQRMIENGRKNLIITSPKLRELSERKKWLVKDGNYHDAIRINHQIEQEKRRLE